MSVVLASRFRGVLPLPARVLALPVVTPVARPTCQHGAPVDTTRCHIGRDHVGSRETHMFRHQTLAASLRNCRQRTTARLVRIVLIGLALTMSLSMTYGTAHAETAAADTRLIASEDAATTSATPTSSALASSADATTLARCYPQNSYVGIFKSGHHIKAYAGFPRECRPNTCAFFELERYRGFGSWQLLGSKRICARPNDHWFTYNCTGSGTQTYRAVIFGRTLGDRPWSKYTPELRKRC